jgi:hypothetical protein
MRTDKMVFNSFSNRLTWEDFETKLDSLPKRDNFLNASRLYQQALKCEGCARKVAMVLLCSCADAMQLVGERNSRKNFKKFYESCCPNDLRKPPIKYYLDGKPLTYNDASFGEALDYIYTRFRCSYVHDGIDYLELPKGLSGYTIIDELRKIKDKHLVIDILKILDWFKIITFESLYNFLMNPL